MNKIILRLKHFFTGHGLIIEADDYYLYCDCGVKYRHYAKWLVDDWIKPYLRNKKL